MPVLTVRSVNVCSCEREREYRLIQREVRADGVLNVAHTVQFEYFMMTTLDGVRGFSMTVDAEEAEAAEMALFEVRDAARSASEDCGYDLVVPTVAGGALFVPFAAHDVDARFIADEMVQALSECTKYGDMAGGERLAERLQLALEEVA